MDAQSDLYIDRLALSYLSPRSWAAVRLWHGFPNAFGTDWEIRATSGIALPDGKKIAYVWQRDRDAQSQEKETFLMVMDADGKNSTVVLSDKSQTAGIYYSSLAFFGPVWR
jgi:hypothetical protein